MNTATRFLCILFVFLWVLVPCQAQHYRIRHSRHTRHTAKKAPPPKYVNPGSIGPEDITPAPPPDLYPVRFDHPEFLILGIVAAIILFGGSSFAKAWEKAERQRERADELQEEEAKRQAIQARNEEILTARRQYAEAMAAIPILGGKLAHARKGERGFLMSEWDRQWSVAADAADVAREWKLVETDTGAAREEVTKAKVMERKREQERQLEAIWKRSEES